jgi:hypothetical protein
MACFLQYSLSTAKGETNVVLVFDSGHYQETARLLVAVGSANARDQSGHGQKQMQDLAQGLMLDGPILPGLAAITFLSFGNLFALSDWQCLLGLQAVLHGLAAALVFLLGRQIFSPSNKWALAAGLLWAINPIAVLASQRFLSENLAADLLLALVLLSCRIGKNSGLRLCFLAVISGITAALVLFTKAALAPAVVLALAVSVSWEIKCARESKESKSKSTGVPDIVILVFGLAAGASLIILPWAIYTNNAIGKAQYFPQRAPVLNLLVGWNSETDGLSTLPVAPVSKALQSLYDKTGSAPQAVLGLWRQEPIACASLALRKVTRLYGLPWNDFRRNCLLFSPKMQQYLHQAIIVLALLSVCLALGRGAPFAFWLSSLLIAGHFVFLLFEGVPRYAFSSYPFLFLLALYCLRQLAGATWKRRQLWVCTSAGVVLLFLINLRVPQVWFFSQKFFNSALATEALYFASLLALLLTLSCFMPMQFNARQLLRYRIALACSALFYAHMVTWMVPEDSWSTEWQSRLSSGQTAERVFSLRGSIEKPAFALLLIDGARQVGEGEISVNGQSLKERAVNLFDYFPDRKIHYLFAEQVAAFMGRSPSEIRRWWAVPVPLAALNDNLLNTIALKVPANASVRLFGEYPAQADDWQSFRPGFLYISPGKIWTSNDSYEWRAGRPFSTKTLGGESSIIGADGTRVKQKGQWRMILLIGAEPEIAHVLEKGMQEPRVLDVF